MNFSTMRIVVLTWILSSGFFGQIYSQNIFERLDDSSSKGVIEVIQDESIRLLVGTPLTSSQNNGTHSITTLGYRIQVFSGNKQRASKDEAFSKELKIKTSYPDQTTYVTFNSPFWKLRVGDFRSYEEADDVMRSMRKQFPDFSKEMFIVREEIRILF